MRLLFGQKAYQSAGCEGSPAARREWLQKAVRELLRVVDSLDTTPRHKQALMAELEAITQLLKRIKEPTWVLVYGLFRLTLQLLGFYGGAKCHTPAYFQTREQYFTVQLLGGDASQYYYDQKDAISLRRDLVMRLRDEGFDDFKISLVLNTTEHQVKQLRSWRKPKRTGIRTQHESISR